MNPATFDELLEAGVHFGHLKRKWNPKMAPYIFMERNGIHVIDLQKTAVMLNEALNSLKENAKIRRKILFVATKKQAKDIVSEKVKPTNMPFVTERWPGGMLTNFPTIKRTIKKMATIDKRFADGTYDKLQKRERLQIQRQRNKLEKTFGSISNMNRPPAALFIVDVTKEHIAVREAQRLNIPIFAMVDTNSDPQEVDFPIPANDDASKSISYVVEKATEAILEGKEEKKMEKEKSGGAQEKEKKGAKKDSKETEKTGEKRKTRARKAAGDQKKTTESQENKQPETKQAETDNTENKIAGNKQTEDKQAEQPKEQKENQSDENKSQTN